MTNRMKNFDLNNRFAQGNAKSIADQAPGWAVHYVVADESVVGYYSNWIDAADAMGTQPGAVLGNL